MNVLRSLPIIRTIVQVMSWLWEPMTFTDPFAGRTRPGLLTRTQVPSKPAPRPLPALNPVVPKQSPKRALAMGDWSIARQVDVQAVHG